MKRTKVVALTNPRTGRPVPNHFIHLAEEGKLFQSYDVIICKIDNDGNVSLDEVYWNYSATTSKYRAIFLDETTKQTEAKIKSGLYKIDNLNEL